MRLDPSTSKPNECERDPVKTPSAVDDAEGSMQEKSAAKTTGGVSLVKL